MTTTTVPTLDVTFTILVTLDVTANSRLHWTKRARRTREIRETCRFQALMARSRHDVPIAQEKRTVHLTLIRGKGQRLLDADSAYSACKPVLDALVDADWLVDDSLTWVDYTVSQERGSDPGGSVVVRVTSVEETE